jgi:hypothetical protein
MLLATVAAVAALLGVDDGRAKPLDPATLRPLSRGTAVGSLLGPVAWSPDRRDVAVAVRPRGRVQVVGGRTFATGTSAAWVTWAGDRLFSVGFDGAIAVTDPRSGRVVARAGVAGPVEDAQAAGDRLVVVSEQRLAVVEPGGAVRRVPLPGVIGGGLAASERTAYVAHTGGVIEVSLADGKVVRHPLARAAKDERRWRSAELVGGQTLAVSGCDRIAADHRGCARPYGLRLLDTRTWSARVLDTRAAAFKRSGDLLVLDAAAFGEGRRYGLRVFSSDGRREWLNTFRGRDILVQASPSHVYAHFIRRPRSRTRAIDVRSGAVRMLPARIPYLL